MRKLLCAMALAVLTCTLITPVFANNGIEDVGTTVRQLSRGGAFVATDPDVGAIMGNPAALAFLDGAEFYIDGRVWHSKLDYQGALSGLGQKENYVIPNVGYASSTDGRLAWGAGIFTTVNSAFRVTDYDLSLVGAPPGTTDRSSTKVRFVVLTPSLAYRLSDDTAIGATLQYTSGSADFQAYDMLGNTLGYRLGEPNGKGHSLRLGLYHQADDDTTLGAYWRSRTHLKVTGGVLQMGALTETPGVEIPGTSIVGFQFPEQYGVGIEEQLDCNWTAMAEYRRLLWSQGSDTVDFVPPQGETLSRDMNWSDQNVYILGAEYRPNGEDDSIWRFGLNYAASPVPDSSVSPLYPAINEMHYTCGWEGELSDGLSLVTGALYSPQVTRTSAAGNRFNQILGLGQPFSVALENWELGVGLSWDIGGGKSDKCYADCDPCGRSECSKCADPCGKCESCDPCDECDPCAPAPYGALEE